MTDVIVSGAAAMGDGTTRKEKRKAMKKVKRKQTRKEAAVREREEEEARQNDPDEQLRIRIKEQEEAEAVEMERKAFEERERLWLEAAAARKAAEEAEAAEAEERKKLLLEEEKKHKEQTGDFEENDDWEYVEEGPAEIIWQGNEIIVKKKRVKIPKEGAKGKPVLEDSDRPTSNPLPPQSSAFASYMNEPSNSAQEALEKVAQQVPNFGTEQDKAHCPFHLKTGACRFGSRCSRIHFHPDKSCTLLIKNMYNGPGLAWEQDEGLEYTDEEVERAYEEFYEDVHREFLKYGELVNFKVCRNGSYHLRGNVYVHYKSLDSAVLAYTSTNGRYYAGKQITCEFISVTKWKVAICGDFMKSRFKTCSHGSACNFIHCFRNPGGDYEWADWDNPPPKHWTKKMIALFGPSNESDYDRLPVEGSERSDRKRTMASNRFHSRLENETDSYSRRSRGEDSHVQDNHFSYHSNRKSKEVPSEQSDRKSKFKDNLKIKDSTYDSHSENENKSDKYQKHKGRHRSEDDSFKGKREKQPYSKKYMKDDQYERYSNQHEQESRELYRHSGSYEEPHRENEENKSDKLRRHKGRHRSGEYSYKRKREEPYSNYSMKYIEDDQYEPRYNGQHGQESREPSRHSSSDDESDRKNEENKSDKFQKHKGRHKSGEYSYERKREEPYSNYSKKYIEDDLYEPRYSGQHGQESREPSRHSSSDDESDRKNEENKSNKLRKHKRRHRSGEYSYKRKREEPYSNYSKKYIEDDQYEPRYSDQHEQESREPSRHSSSDGNREEPYSNYSKKYIEDDTYEPRYSDQHGQESQEPSRHSSSDGNRE